MWFTTGGWVMFVIFTVLFVALVALAVFSMYRDSRSYTYRDWTLGIVAGLIGAVLALFFVALLAWSGRQNANAIRDLEAAGFTVVWVESFSNRAVVEQDGVRREVMLYKSPQTGRYTAYLLCSYDMEPIAIDQCITEPK